MPALTRRICLPLLLWLVLAVAPAAAAIIDCSGAGRSFTVYLDEPAYGQSAFQNDAELRTFMDRLWFFLDQDRDRQWLEESQSPVGFAFCKGRKPSLDGREFDRPLIDLLYNQGVILEIWGTLDAQLDNGQPKNRQARIGYLLVPVEFVGPTATPSGRIFVRYPESPGESEDDFLNFFRDSADLDAFIATGLGIRALRSGNLTLAQGNLCQAKLLLEQQARTPNLPARRKTQLLELASFVSESATKAIRSAHDQPGDLSPLRLLDPNRPCPQEGSP